ncbi:hypothetical protein LCGC14_1450940 [marine sediment metagenome]|uniref:Uncharacterized protein n=1 Tax=marine sediment metagenome TaxID=412755 RepID=A0A0F9JIL6_9ZZZZ
MDETLYVKYRAILSPLEDGHESAQYATGRFILGPEFFIGASGDIAHCLHWIKEFVSHGKKILNIDKKAYTFIKPKENKNENN